MRGVLLRPAGAVLLLLLPSLAQGQRAIFVVRHAEKATESNDPPVPLSPAGTERARRLAAMLKDAGVTAIFATDFVRTRATAQPLAEMRHVAVRIYAPKDAQGRPTAEPLLQQLHKLRSDDVALVVGHGDTVPVLLQGLGVAEPIAIGGGEYDNLFVVVPQPGGRPLLLRLRF